MATKKKKVSTRKDAPEMVVARIPKKAKKTENEKPVARPRRRAEIARVELRERLWADSEKFLWQRTKEFGFTTIPRTLMLIATLIKELTKQGDASRVYLDLWGRAFDEGLVEVFDESEFALSSGYAPGKRNVRTWRERIKELQRLKFIAVRPKAGREIGYILLIHPHSAVMNLMDTIPEKIPEWWSELFTTRVREIRAELPRDAGLNDFFQSANGPLPKEAREPLSW
jgi:hypothetical protein